MIVTKDTKISKLIAEKPKVIDTIASINKHFKKLKNPVFRRVFASRVTVADAAKIGGVSVEQFLKKIEEAGFEINNDSMESEATKKGSINKMKDKEAIISMDVRPIIESGSDPFTEIMSAANDLQEHETLEIINSFEPIPLIHKLEESGFESWTERKEEGVVHTYFKKSNSEELEIVNRRIDETSSESFNEKLLQFGDQIKKIDVRHLEMPLPMATILQEIEILPKGNALFVEHKKIPQFLLPELATRNFEILFNEVSENNVQLIIFKK